MNKLFWSHVVAEEPFDKMGEEFADTFSTWVFDNSWTLTRDFQEMAFELFKFRLDLAQKHNTYFASQMTAGGREVWRDRFEGVGYDPCYSFAIKNLDRTKRFWNWAVNRPDLPNSIRFWDEDFAPYPHLPVEGGAHERSIPMRVWEHTYRPFFIAKRGGALKMRCIQYNDNTFLFEHVRNNWVPLMRGEAQAWWTKAVAEQDPHALAAFEWVYYWTNPFGRAAASIGDALSLIVQKRHGFQMRTDFYHQDCEALLMSFEDYVAKRASDMFDGFKPRFVM